MSAPTSGELRSGDLRGRVVRSLSWSFAGNLVGRAGNVVVGIALAHILVPRDFGVFAVALVGVLFVTSLNDVGLAATIVRWPGDLSEVAPTAVTIIFTSSVVLYLVCFLAAPLVAAGLGAPDAVGVLRLLALVVLLDGAAAVPTVLLTRSFQQDRRTLADLSGFAVQVTVTLTLAKLGYGPWSLAWGRLAGNSVIALLIILLAPARYRPGFGRRQARALLGFGLPLTLTSVLIVATANVDYIVVGHILGPVLLGFYVIAVNVSTWPQNLLSLAVRRVSLAGFSRLRDDGEALARGFSRAVALLVTVALPACVLMSTLAEPLVGLLYGHRWDPAVSALRFLALAAAIRLTLDLFDDALVAAGHLRDLVLIRSTWVLALAGGLSAGARLDGIRGAAIAWLAVAGVVVAPAYLAAARRLGVRTMDLLRLLARPTLGAGLAAALAITLQHALSGSVGNLAQLAIAGAVAAAGYALVALPMRRLVASMPELAAGPT